MFRQRRIELGGPPSSGRAEHRVRHEELRPVEARALQQSSKAFAGVVSRERAPVAVRSGRCPHNQAPCAQARRALVVDSDPRRRASLHVGTRVATPGFFPKHSELVAPSSEIHRQAYRHCLCTRDAARRRALPTSNSSTALRKSWHPRSRSPASSHISPRSTKASSRSRDVSNWS